MKRRELKAEVIEREFDGAWQVVTPASLVRLNETSRELVRKGEAVDLTRWITVFVGKSKKECCRGCYFFRGVSTILSEMSLNVRRDMYERLCS